MARVYRSRKIKPRRLQSIASAALVFVTAFLGHGFLMQPAVIVEIDSRLLHESSLQLETQTKKPCLARRSLRLCFLRVQTRPCMFSIRERKHHIRQRRKRRRRQNLDSYGTWGP